MICHSCGNALRCSYASVIIYFNCDSYVTSPWQFDRYTTLMWQFHINHKKFVAGNRIFSSENCGGIEFILLPVNKGWKTKIAIIFNSLKGDWNLLSFYIFTLVLLLVILKSYFLPSFATVYNKTNEMSMNKILHIPAIFT